MQHRLLLTHGAAESEGGLLHYACTVHFPQFRVVWCRAMRESILAEAIHHNCAVDNETLYVPEAVVRALG